MADDIAASARPAVLGREASVAAAALIIKADVLSARDVIAGSSEALQSAFAADPYCTVAFDRLSSQRMLSSDLLLAMAERAALRPEDEWLRRFYAACVAGSVTDVESRRAEAIALAPHLAEAPEMRATLADALLLAHRPTDALQCTHA